MIKGPTRKNVLIIAEIAQAHDGSLGILHSLIESAARLGVDAIKFQVHIAKAESTILEPFRINFSYEDKNRFDYWKRMEFSLKQWREIKDKCEKLDVEFLATPFSTEAVDLLESLKVKRYKIGSGDLNNLLLIDKIIKTGKEIFLSTGMASIKEIEFIANRIRISGNKLTLFQCTSNYPTKADEVNLEVINDYKEKFNCQVGLSDHTGEIYAALGAVALGADVIEVHFTFSKEMFGPDSKSSLSLDQLENLVKGIRFLEKARCGDLDTKNNKDFGRLKKTFGRSLYLKRSLKKNEFISSEDMEAKKPADIGINAFDYEQLLGKRALKNLDKGILLKFEDFV